MAFCRTRTCCTKSFILFVAVVILLQGFIYLGLSIFGLMRKTCSENDANSECIIKLDALPIGFMFDLIYFIDHSQNVTLEREIPNDDNTTTFNINLEFYKKENVIIDRTLGILITYAIISALWIVLSLVILTISCVPFTKRVARFYFWPWFIAILAGSALDLIATGYHVFDVMGTMGSSSTLEYIGANVTPPEAEGLFSSFSFLFFVPALVMACLSSRLILFWLFNICASSCCLTLSQVLASDFSLRKRMKSPKLNDYNKHYNRHQKDDQQNNPEKDEMDPSFIQAYPNLSGRSSFVSLPDINRTPNTTNSISSLLEGQSNANNHQDNSHETVSYRNIDTHPDRLNYPAYLRPATNSAIPADLSSLTPLNLRYMSNSGQKINQTPQTAKNQPTMHQPTSPTGDEIKRHLPWSYTNASSTTPSSNQVPARKVNSDYQAYPSPTIPAPDYDRLD